jgi:hypothetical protein
MRCWAGRYELVKDESEGAVAGLKCKSAQIFGVSRHSASELFWVRRFRNDRTLLTSR